MSSPTSNRSFRASRSGRKKAPKKNLTPPDEDAAADTHSIVCPFFNEEGCLPELHRRLKAVAASLASCEIIYVDDGSTDGGPAAIARLIEGDPSCSLIRFEKNSGKTAALLAGIRRARGEAIVSIDADLQSPPEAIPALVGALAGADMAIGIRKDRQDTASKRWTSRISNSVRRAVIGDTIRDVGCDLRAFRRAAAEHFLPYEGFHRFFPAAVQLSGLRVAQIETPHEKRFAGSSKYSFGNRSLNVVFDLFAVRWMLRRRVSCRLKEKL